MTTETDPVATASAELTHAMSQFVKAIDDRGDDGEAVRHVPEDLPGALDRLAARINAARGLGG